MSTPNRPPSTEVTKTYRRPIPNTWWLKKRSTLLFMIREWSSVFVALYALCLLGQLCALSKGAESYNALLAKSLSGASLVLHLVMGVFVLYHTVTWFKISGRIFGSGPLSPGAVTAINYVVWVAASIGVFYWIF